MKAPLFLGVLALFLLEESGPASVGTAQPGLTTNDEVTSHGS